MHLILSIIHIDKGYGTALMKEVAKVSGTITLANAYILFSYAGLCIYRLLRIKTAVEWYGKSLTGTPKHWTCTREWVEGGQRNG